MTHLNEFVFGIHVLKILQKQVVCSVRVIKFVKKIIKKTSKSSYTQQKTPFSFKNQPNSPAKLISITNQPTTSTKNHFPQKSTTKSLKNCKLSQNDGTSFSSALREWRTFRPHACVRIVAFHGRNRDLCAVERGLVRLETADDVQHTVNGGRGRP